MPRCRSTLAIEPARPCCLAGIVLVKNTFDTVLKRAQISLYSLVGKGNLQPVATYKTISTARVDIIIGMNLEVHGTSQHSVPNTGVILAEPLTSIANSQRPKEPLPAALTR